jgi:predicted nucleotidyltransferase
MGMLLRPLDAILASPAKVRVLRALLAIGEGGVSGRKVGRLAGVEAPSAFKALADLSAMGVVHREHLESQHLYSVNEANPLVREGLRPLFDAEQRRVSAAFTWLRELLAGHVELGAVRSVVLYGSAVRGDDRPGSDLDLLVVTTTQEAVAEVHRYVANQAPELEERFGLDLAPLVISHPRLREQLEAGDMVMAAAIREGRRVAGEPLDDLLPAAVKG